MNIDILYEQHISAPRHRQIERLLSRFEPIALAQMADVTLLDRVDTKYLLPTGDLYAILTQVRDHYRILDIYQVRLNRYHTVYFDDPAFTLYHQHHNRHASRYKIRTRQYVDSNLTFFEVKHKTNKRRTEKTRLPLHHSLTEQAAEISTFVGQYVDVGLKRLEPKLWNDYLRVTLVGRTHPERVTIDLDLSFGHDAACADLPGLTIAEVKQAHFSQRSPFMQQMRQRGIRSTSFSKYCIGVCLLYDGVKINNFKPVMHRVHQIIERGTGYHAGIR